MDKSLSSLPYWTAAAVGIVVGGLALYSTYAGAAATQKSISSNTKTKKSNKPTSSSSTTVTKKSKSTVVDKEGSVEINETSELRGYKLTADGRKTSYFNRELSHEEIQLIGDITPKKIGSENDIIDNSPKLLHTTKTTASVSAWNTAGTWEEKTVTNWVHSHLKKLLNSINISLTSKDSDLLQSAVITITNITTLTGDALIANVRGKKKYIYDLHLELSWKVQATMKDGNKYTLTGDAIITEITPENELEMSVTTGNGVANHFKKVFDTFLKGESNKSSLFKQIQGVCAKLLADLKENY